ncbi:hypothetical protein [Dysgonomonas sp. GY617]|uniref:hypothetical protein n=1 Tax=Dysgonomonas sp. GY617 TaxID=2780420 RepID=UPI001883A20C|nr:hypothetical protein [Dysgonomonas sp. GY617]MBF0576387.1 hypothetical protein [Dysgonomonas sp. GY617]
MHKIHSLILLFFLFSTIANSQSIEDLDKKNGFNQFQLGDSYTKWQSDLKLTQFEYHIPNAKLYFYTGKCCQDLFGFKVEGIFMTFQNDKLVEININLDRERQRQDSQILVDCQSKLKRVINSLVALYGIPQSGQEPKDLQKKDPTYILAWIGKKAILKLEHSYVLSGNFECKTEITVSDWTWKEETYKPEF